MADTRVDIPGVGPVDFPDGMSADDINAAAKRLHDEANPPESMGRRVGRAALDTLPYAGAMLGGAIGAPAGGLAAVPGLALGAGIGRGARDLIAEYTGLDAPTSPIEKAGSIAKETAVQGAIGAVMPGAVEAIKTPLQTTREVGQMLSRGLPQSVRRLGNILPSLPKGAAAPILERPAFQTWGRAAVEEAAPAARAEAMTSGTGFLRTGPVPAKGGPSWSAWKAERPPGASPSPTAPQSQGLSSVERTALAKQGYSPEVIAKIEQSTARSGRQAPVASHAPAETPAIQQPRVQIGAERVGKQAGMTTQEVRIAAGPVLDEAAGEASPILPQKALQRIIDDMKALPKGGPEREAYVARATSGKTKSQVENVRRTLEHLGLIVPFAVAAPTVRDELQRLMASHQQAGS